MKTLIFEDSRLLFLWRISPWMPPLKSLPVGNRMIINQTWWIFTGSFSMLIQETNLSFIPTWRKNEIVWLKVCFGFHRWLQTILVLVQLFLNKFYSSLDILQWGYILKWTIQLCMRAQLLIQKFSVINQGYFCYVKRTARCIHLHESKWPVQTWSSSSETVEKTHKYNFHSPCTLEDFQLQKQSLNWIFKHFFFLRKLDGMGLKQSSPQCKLVMPTCLSKSISLFFSFFLPCFYFFQHMPLSTTPGSKIS